MVRRSGTTLTEVLIAIFIMGLGLLAILSLFPLGAAQMAQALKDQRCAEAAGNAATLARVMWKQVCDEAVPNSVGFRETLTGLKKPYAPHQPFLMAMDDPNYNLPAPNNIKSFQFTPINTMSARPADGPLADTSSYPVLVDPIGWESHGANGAANKQGWVGYSSVFAGQGFVPRRPLYYKDPSTGQWGPMTRAASALLLRNCSLVDDLTFNTNGSALKVGTTVERQGRYTWAYLYRRTRNGPDNRRKADLTVVVYSGRSLDVPSKETPYIGSSLGPKSIGIEVDGSVNDSKPEVRRGTWIFDATIFDATGNVSPQGRFYRVVNVDEGTSASGKPFYTYEIQTPLAPGPTQRVFVVMDKVVEVFNKGEVSDSASPTVY